MSYVQANKARNNKTYPEQWCLKLIDFQCWELVWIGLGGKK